MADPTTKISIVFDCADPDRLARFWMVALPGFAFPGSPVEAPDAPPEGYATWRRGRTRRASRRRSATVAAPWWTAPAADRTFFLRVPEGKFREPRNGHRRSAARRRMRRAEAALGSATELPRPPDNGAVHVAGAATGTPRIRQWPATS
jgi:ribosomal protein L32